MVKSGRDVSKEFSLRGTTRIGRSDESEITLTDAQASRHHAAISPEPGGPAFGTITFAQDKTDANEPVDPTSTFPAGTLWVYAL